MPPLPPKSVICMRRASYADPAVLLTCLAAKFRPRFLERRKAGLSYFLKYVFDALPKTLADIEISCVLLNPEFSGSPVLKDFLFS